MAFAQLLDSLYDVLETTFLTHLIGGEVGVASGAIPVSRNRLLFFST